MEVLANFLEKGKVPASSGEPREARTLLEWEYLLLVTMKQAMLPLENLKEHIIEYFLLNLLLHAVELFLGQGIYSLPQIYLSWLYLVILSLDMDH